MPSVTKMVGYFPGRVCRLGQDLPKGFAMDWAGRRKPDLMASREYRERFAAILDGYGRVRARALAITVTDDAFAPADAARRLLAVYPGISAVHEIVSPADLGAEHLGHMAFVSRSARRVFLAARRGVAIADRVDRWSEFYGRSLSTLFPPERRNVRRTTPT